MAEVNSSTEGVIPLNNLDLKTQSELLSYRNSEELQKVSDRVHMIAEHLRNLYDQMVEFVHGKALLRDVGDGLAKAFNQLGQLDQLPVPTSTNFTMTLLGDTILNIGDKMDSEVNHFETEIFPIFSAFGCAFKHIKNQIHEARQSEDQHFMKRNEYYRFVEREKIMPQNKFIEKERHLKEKLCYWMTQSTEHRQKCIKMLVKLERKKCEDLKKLLSKWFLAQASVAAKTLELCTDASRTALVSIDTAGDINKLLKHFNLLDSVVRKSEVEISEPAEQPAAVPEQQKKGDAIISPLEFPSKEKHDQGACGDTGKKSKDKRRHNHHRVEAIGKKQ